MIDSYLRMPFQKILFTPLGRGLTRILPNPFYYTCAALISGILSAYFIVKGLPYVAIIFLGLSGLFDVLDGTVARISMRASPKGAVLDITFDRLVEFSLVLGLYLYASNERAFLSILLLGSILFCVTTFLVVSLFLDEKTEKSFTYHPGLMERTETFFLFALMIVFPSAFSFLGCIFVFLVTLTGGVRLFRFVGFDDPKEAKADDGGKKTPDGREGMVVEKV